MTNKLNLKSSWQDIADSGVRGKELISTWASLSILHEDDIISELIDKKSGSSVKDNIILPLYPLAEWIALNWWFLLYEPFTPNKIDPKEYDSRHNFSYAREGYALPNLSIKPMGDAAILEWRRASLKNHKINFITSGQATISTEALKENLFDFVDKVVNRLDTKGIFGTLLQEEWDSIQNLTADEVKFCQIAASASIDPFNVSSGQSEAITKIYSELPEEVIPDFFASCDPLQIEQDAELTMNAISSVKTNDFYVKELNSIRHKIELKTKSHHYPWREGYEAAKELRKELKLNGHIFESIYDIGKAFKVPENNLQQIITHKELPHSISVVSGVNQNDSPYFVLGNMRANSSKEKFAYCRALYDYFFSTHSEVSLITKSHIENQKRNRAFAAEFLVPAEKLRQAIAHEKITEEEIEDLADKFFVDPFVIKHQIENHRIAEIDFNESYY